MIVNIKKFKERCMKFAEESVESSSSMWSRGGRISKERLIYDIYVGKLGEWAAYTALKYREDGITKPDHRVLTAGQKSFDADLQSPQYLYHCKTQSMESSAKYGISWIFQYEEGGRKDPMVKNPGPKDVAVLMCMGRDEVKIMAIVKVVDLVKANALEEAASPFFRNSKKAIYWETIKSMRSIKEVK